MRKLLLAAWLTQLLCNKVCGQSLPILSISDKIPEITLNHFPGNEFKSVSFSALRGKLVILDFWNVRCSSCIASMPKLDSLQRLFGDNIQILLVTKDPAAAVEKLFNKLSIPKPNLPILSGDTILNQLFPHKGDPMTVWIGKQGEILAITEPYNTNALNIAKVIAGEPLKLPRRWDFGINFDYPLMSEQNKAIGALALYHSVLYKGLQEYSSLTTVKIITDSARQKPILIEAVNVSLLQLLSIAYCQTLFGFTMSIFDLPYNNRIWIDVKNPGIFSPPINKDELSQWISNNQFSYELGMEPGQNKDLFCFMQADLNRYFDYDITIEKVKIQCLVLVRTSDKDRIQTSDPCQISGIFRKENTISIRNMPLQTSLIKRMVLANYRLSTPIIDETGYHEMIDLDITNKLDDINELKKELHAYDLDLVEKVAEINMLVVRDKPVL